MPPTSHVHLFTISFKNQARLARKIVGSYSRVFTVSFLVSFQGSLSFSFDSYFRFWRKKKWKPYIKNINIRSKVKLRLTDISHAKYTVSCNIYIDFDKYTFTWKRLSLEELKTLDIGTRLFDNAAFVRIYVMKRFSEDFLEVRELRGGGSQLWLI